MKARILDIKRFAIHDGDGIRTTVFFKGCPLKCVWCHNPEGISAKPQLAYYERKCISCGECVSVCLAGAHKMVNGAHFFDREKCVGCGKCETACLGNALKFYGKEYTVDELLEIVLKDRSFYEKSGGGVTLSGGECTLQADFCAEFLKKLKERNINTAVDTCGFAKKSDLDKIIPYTDVFLYDVKAIDEDVHIKCTGKSNKKILENLKYLDDCGARIEVRVPFVPEFNDNQMFKIKEFLGNVKNLVRVKILPYHNLAGSKYLALGLNNTMPKKLPSAEQICNVENFFK